MTSKTSAVAPNATNAVASNATNAGATTAADCLQLVDGDAFIGNKHESVIKESLKDWTTNYNVVAVLGRQGSGKSTLLNALFGTQFPVSEDISQRQTTKGIWMSKSPNMNVLALDTEGSDDFAQKSELSKIEWHLLRLRRAY
ncbi:P-loop containing nucleoside triphosphate hydrolase protein [Thamnocephalis sphaerospora]|uniref:P-loop containing nucleoside triphosphate hydrolase protein n=1 Tax=Thamnocephalis sphaerospora TaxID=78915 RepID=A0A4P9XJ01_9FUNG|nr:P-loop containing nucleoside triphosphate hydrolase protein [Thamnocephalis sphaerospora]|eukprot:RKP05341.1 P-loop containing nucleoside triphosphate hydrolase protein [Thamnocephalis sphaerospora]